MSGAAEAGIDDALALAAGGDDDAFARLVRQHQAMVFSVAYHFLHNRTLAEDIAQDVFVDLYRNIRSIQSAAHLKHWLRKVASHRSIDHARARGGNVEVNLDETAELADPVEEPDPLLRDRLRRMVASLPERARLVVILRFQEELEYHEIAEALEMPINTVKSNLQRALAILRGKLVRALGDVPV